MRRTQSMQAGVARGIVLALLFSAVASAQEPIPGQTGNQARTGEPSSPQARAADTGATQASAAQLPDSPGAVQARLIQPAMTPALAPVNGGQSSDNMPRASRESDPDSALSPESGNRIPDPSSSEPPASSQTDTQPSAQPPEPNRHEPLGTAAAETLQTTGVAASRPAGAAVAPGKQRRARSILIKVGAIAAVGAAVATTWALSQGSPGNPPGSH